MECPMPQVTFSRFCYNRFRPFCLKTMLLLSISLLVFSVLLTWYMQRAAVMSPMLRPLIINTPTKTFLFVLLRLLTTSLAVFGIYSVTGLAVAAGSYLIRLICGRLIYRQCFRTAVAEQTELLLRWNNEDAQRAGRSFDREEMLAFCHQTAVETVTENISWRELTSDEQPPAHDNRRSSCFCFESVCPQAHLGTNRRTEKNSSKHIESLVV